MKLKNPFFIKNGFMNTKPSRYRRVDKMEGLIIIRYNKNMSEKALARWEHIEILLESNRELRSLYEAIQKINRDYRFSLETYVDSESSKWLRKFNEFFVELEYDLKYPKAIKQFSNALEQIRV